MSGGSALAGWFPDPSGRHEERWWDHPHWTDDVRDGGVRSTDPLVAAPAPADTSVLDAPAFLIAMPHVGGGTWQVMLPVVSAGDERPLGWVHFGKERTHVDRATVWANLVDPSGAPLVGARGSTYVSPERAGPIRFGEDRQRASAFHAVTILDAHAAEVSTSRRSHALGRHRIRFSLHGSEVVRLELNNPSRHQVEPTTLTAGGVPVGSVVQLGQRAFAGPPTSWLRLDRAPGLREPLRTFAAAAPLVLLTYLN